MKSLNVIKRNLGTIVIALAIIITAIIFANAFKNRNSNSNVISVTGLGKRDFVSDLIVWKGYFSRKSLTLKESYSFLDADREEIQNYLLKNGIKKENIVFSSVEIEKEYEHIYNNEGRIKKSVLSGYKLRQNVQIESNEVDKVENISRKVTELINNGVEFYSFPPEYYYTKLAELKIEMIAEATKDGNIRAKKIAENAGSKLGNLINAYMGVFQIVAQNSSEEYSWGGSFNTSSKRKTATITVKLDYNLR